MSRVFYCLIYVCVCIVHTHITICMYTCMRITQTVVKVKYGSCSLTVAFCVILGLNVFAMCLQCLCLNVKQDESDILSQLFQFLLGDPRALPGQMGCLIPAGKNVKTV